MPSQVTRDLSLTFAGGGNRAFYSYGVLSAWGRHLAPRLAGMAMCSAGACVPLMWITGREDAARETFLRLTQGLTRNIDWRRPLRGEALAPHGRILREILLSLLREGGLERVRAFPVPLMVLVAAFPRWMPGGLAVAVGIGAYQLEKVVRPAMRHPTFGRAVGFRPRVFDLRACVSPDEAADLILASSATPPFTPIGRFGGESFLDGGMVDNAPASVGDALPGATRNVVFLTRCCKPGTAGVHEGRLYLAPLTPPMAHRWDYTRPHLVEATIAQGRAEAATHWTALEAYLAE